ncbi:MAG TPA: hypothetical protein VFQ45_04410 [Longimicrobium sp.]|nr:hypothetical protein [Longimicrobium sp.]
MTIRSILPLMLAAAVGACESIPTTVEGWPEDGVTPATGTYEYRLDWRKQLAPADTGTVKDSASLGTLTITEPGTGGFVATWAVSGYAGPDTAAWNGSAYELAAERASGTKFTVTHRLYRKEGIGSLTCEATITAVDPLRPVNALGCTVTRIRAAPES